MGETKQTLVNILDADEDYIRVDNCTELSFTDYEEGNPLCEAEEAEDRWYIRMRNRSIWDLSRFEHMEPFVYKVEDRVYIHRDLKTVRNVMNCTFGVFAEWHDAEYVWTLDIDEITYESDTLQIVIRPEMDQHYFGFVQAAENDNLQELLDICETNENDCWDMRDERYRDVWEYLTRSKIEKWLRYRSPRDRFSNGEADTIRKKWIQQREERHGDIVVPILQASKKHIPKELLSLISNLENPTPEERKRINDRKRIEALKKYVPGHASSKRRKIKLRF